MITLVHLRSGDKFRFPFDLPDFVERFSYVNGDDPSHRAWVVTSEDFGVEVTNIQTQPQMVSSAIYNGLLPKILRERTIGDKTGIHPVMNDFGEYAISKEVAKEILQKAINTLQ